MTDPIRILILEDDIPTRDSLAHRITGASDMVVCNASGSLADAQRFLADDAPDALLVDLQLPDGDATALIAECTSRIPDKPILVISVFGDENRVVAAIEAGAQGYLLKDDAGEDLVNAIRQVLAGESPISPAIARHLIKRFQIAPIATKNDSVLSERQLEVLRLASKGLTYQETAKMLGVTVNTVGTYTRRVYAKLAVSSRAQALFEARQLGLMGKDE